MLQSNVYSYSEYYANVCVSVCASQILKHFKYFLLLILVEISRFRLFSTKIIKRKSLKCVGLGALSLPSP